MVYRGTDVTCGEDERAYTISIVLVKQATGMRPTGHRNENETRISTNRNRNLARIALTDMQGISGHAAAIDISSE